MIFISVLKYKNAKLFSDNFNFFNEYIEIEVGFGFLHIGSVPFLKVLMKYDIPVLAHCKQACFLTNSCNLPISIQSQTI